MFTKTRLLSMVAGGLTWTPQTKVDRGLKGFQRTDLTLFHQGRPKSGMPSTSPGNRSFAHWPCGSCRRPSAEGSGQKPAVTWLGSRSPSQPKALPVHGSHDHLHDQVGRKKLFGVNMIFHM